MARLRFVLNDKSNQWVRWVLIIAGVAVCYLCCTETVMGARMLRYLGSWVHRF